VLGTQVSLIQTEYKIFSILCYISCSAYLKLFAYVFKLDDACLPLGEDVTCWQHETWACEPRLVDVVLTFREVQWKFKPLMIFESFDTYKGLLIPKCILPVIYHKPALSSHDASSATFKVSVYPCCTGPTSRRHPDLS